MSILQIKGITQNYDGHNVLQDINLTVDSGEVFALIGPTGCGKTTLLRILGLLEIPAHGEIFINEVNVTQSHTQRLKARRSMSLVHQKPIVFTMNVFDNVAYGLKLRHDTKKNICEKVERALELVGLLEYKNRNAKTLSGGETQRVAIARAIVTEPEVLFLDEPTANLDPGTTSKVEEVLAQIIRERKTTLVMTTHDMSQGQRLAGRIGVLINGELMQVGTPNEIFCAPQRTEVAEFVGIRNMLAGEVIAKNNNLATISVNNRTIEAISDNEVGDHVWLFIRPEDITFSRIKEISSARNTFECRISKIVSLGPMTRLEADCGFPLFGVITGVSEQELELAVGMTIYASFKATALHTITRWT